MYLLPVKNTTKTDKSRKCIIVNRWKMLHWIIKRITETTVKNVQSNYPSRWQFVSAYSCLHANSETCLGLLVFARKKIRFTYLFLFLSQECPRGLSGYNCTQTCEVPYFGHRCVLGRCSCTRDSCNIPPSICSPKTGKKKGNKQEKTLTLIATYLAFLT